MYEKYHVENHVDAYKHESSVICTRLGLAAVNDFILLSDLQNPSNHSICGRQWLSILAHTESPNGLLSQVHEKFYVINAANIS